MNILLLYNARETFTNTVFEHVASFGKYSAHRWFYAHHDGTGPLDVDLGNFDAVGIHYCVRLPYDQISDSAQERLVAYGGLKFLFIQDEYEHTHRAWHWLEALGIALVFTVVPQESIGRVYPPAQFPGVRFVNNLTGYVPDHPASAEHVVPPSERFVLVGYRGRPLPLCLYGELAYEKTRIGEMVRGYCEERALPHDIDWREEARIYGPRWYEFVASCRATLGTESGSNVFDWDGTLREELAAWRTAHPGASDEQVYDAIVAPHEMPGVMNQVSPRIFEAISLRTVLVLFEGTYSGVVEPWKHFIPLYKDGSNLEEVFRHLADGAFVDAMAGRAYEDVIASGRFGYPAFVRMADGELEQAARQRTSTDARPPDCCAEGVPTPITTSPIRATPPVSVSAVAAAQAVDDLPTAAVAAIPVAAVAPRVDRFRSLVVAGWQKVPPQVRPVLRPIARKGMLPAWRLLRRAYRLLRP